VFQTAPTTVALAARKSSETRRTRGESLRAMERPADSRRALAGVEDFRNMKRLGDSLRPVWMGSRRSGVAWRTLQTQKDDALDHVSRAMRRRVDSPSRHGALRRLPL
jgi:hypothetical protein